MHRPATFALAVALGAFAVAASVRADECTDEKLVEVRRVSFDLSRSPLGRLPCVFVPSSCDEAPPIWAVVKDATAPSKAGRVLAQLATHDVEKRFATCVYEKLTAKDVTVRVRVRLVASTRDASAGIVVRQHKDRGYVARIDAKANEAFIEKLGDSWPLERRWADVSSNWRGPWHQLTFRVHGSKLQLTVDDKTLEETDSSVCEAGKVGLWVAAGTVAHFDELSIEERPAR